MHTDTPRSRLIPFLSTPTGRFGPPDGRLKRFSPAPPTQIRPRKSPLEPPCEGRRKRLRCGPETAVADASASVANSMPSRRAAPTKAFSPSPKKTVRQDKTVRHGKRPAQTKRSAQMKPGGGFSRRWKDASFPHMWTHFIHRCGKPRSIIHKLWKRLFRLLDGQLLPGRRVSLWRVAPKARSPGVPGRVIHGKGLRPKADPSPGVPGRVRLPSPAVIGLLPLSAATRRDVGALASAASVTSRLPACSCGFRRSLRPSRSRLARRRP